MAHGIRKKGTNYGDLATLDPIARSRNCEFRLQLGALSQAWYHFRRTCEA